MMQFIMPSLMSNYYSDQEGLQSANCKINTIQAIHILCEMRRSVTWLVFRSP